MSDDANSAQQRRYRRDPTDSREIDVVPRDPSDAAIAAAYDARAAEYIEIAGSIDQMDAADRSLIGQWRDSTPGDLLDAGCGPGLWTGFLHDGLRDDGLRDDALRDDASREVAGIDISAEFLVSARRRLPQLRFEQGSFRALPFDDASLGGILAWYSLIHTPPEDVPAILTEFARVLAPGGSLLIGYFDGTPREQFAHAVAPAYYWSTDALADLVAEAGFAVSAAEHRDREPGEVSARPHGAVTAIRT